MEEYCTSLLQEIKDQALFWKDREFKTIYLGGGTPSLLLPEQIDRILAAVYKNYNILPEPEISMEANPATLNLKTMQALKQAGINRISLGVQSFQDEELKTLGRSHGSREVWETIMNLEKSGISNYNIDLIYGIPGQSLKTWMNNLGMAVKCHPQHISAYLLQLDPATPLAGMIQKGFFSGLDEDLEAEMYYNCIDYMSSEGFQHYEISNFSKPNYACRHNLIYWHALEYLGLGVGAVSYQNNQRRVNTADLDAYMKALLKGQQCAVEILETMSRQNQLQDAVILGLRLTSGINPEELMKRFGIDLMQAYHANIESLVNQGLLNVESGGRVSLSRKGYFLSNQVLCQFI